METSRKPNDVTVIITWYGQQGHLLNHLEFYASMAKKYDFKPTVIIINDANEPEREFFKQAIDGYRECFNLRGVDVKPDNGFNSHTCRNLGAKLTKTDWLFFLDADTFEQEGFYTELRFNKELREDMFYMPKADMTLPEDMTGYELLDPKGLLKQHAHPNCWIMTRECFWSTGGFDIEYTGVRQGDAEFWLSIGRGTKKWDYDLLSWDDKCRIIVAYPTRDPWYIRQDSWKQLDARGLINFVRTRNRDEYRKYRKRIHNLNWEYV